MKPFHLICKYYPKGTPGHETMVLHGRDVTRKALAVAKSVPHLHPDLRFIAEAAMLHDIGIFRTHAPEIHCHGTEPYIRHGIIGAEILEAHGLPRHARVCERHTGAGISKQDIEKQNLPLPLRDMLPESIEEIIICYADKFFSKNPGDFGREKPADRVLRSLKKFGPDTVNRFESWHAMFSDRK